MSGAFLFLEPGTKAYMGEYDLVVLQADVTNKRLKPGDVGTILTVYNEGSAFEVEFVTLTGEAVAIETLLPHQIRTVRSSEIMAVRDTTQ